MIPLQIKIKNFLSYGSNLQTIDFTHHQLICLTGKNGHGKSALLDALTWALWGQARKISGNPKADQGLLRLGQSDMMVIFDFMVGENTYRVKREFIAGKIKSQQYLDFGIYEENTERLNPLTDKTIRATQALINKTVGLDFETFINSAFIRQGQSNEFSTKSPKERKEILCTILGLSRFERVRKFAHEQSRELTIKKEYAKNNYEHLQDILKQEDSLLNSIEEIQKHAQELVERQQTLIQQTKNLHTEKEQLTKQQQAIKILEVQYEHHQKLSHEYKTELTKHIQTWRSVHQRSLTVGNQKKLAEKKSALELQIKSFQQQQQDHIQLKEKLFQLKDEEQKLIISQEKFYAEILHNLDLEFERYISQKNMLEKNRNEIHRDIQTLALLSTPKEITSEYIKKREADYQKKLATYGRLTVRSKEIVKERENILQKLQLITNECGICPLCNQQLQQTHKLSLHTKFLKREALLSHQERKLVRALENVPVELKNEKKEIEQLSLFLDQQNKVADAEKKQKNITADLLQLDLKINEIQKKRAELYDQNTMSKEHCEKLKSIQAAIVIVRQHINDIGYEEKNHKEAIAELNNILPELEKHKLLQNELWQQPKIKTRIHELCAQMRTLNKETEDLHTQLEQKLQVSLKMREIFAIEQKIAHDTNELAQRQAQYLEKKGRLDQQKQFIESQKKEALALTNTINDLEKQIYELQLISTALGKDGIQALLIEEALPEIEDEANHLLAKLTDNTQQIFIESLRDLKSGKTKETLDIKISDSVGIRAYELFSGGEAFRIDFALRIAISKLLARRAGAALQTLIIDEGFGSQDEEGLSHIMDALHRIQDDFAKIIIVSHLQNMQNQFPSQFFVSKTSSGSQVQIFEQG